MQTGRYKLDLPGAVVRYLFCDGNDRDTQCMVKPYQKPKNGAWDNGINSTLWFELDVIVSKYTYNMWLSIVSHYVNGPFVVSLPVGLLKGFLNWTP